MIRVMVVEDDIIFAQRLVELLLKNGLSVEHCASVEAAKALLIDTPIDVAIIDLMLPPTFGTEGIGLLEFLRRSAPKLNVIMMTSMQTKTTEYVAAAMKSGAHFFIDKQSPDFNTKVLLNIKELLAMMRDNVFISHGHNELLKLKLKDFVQSRLHRQAVILSEQPSRGLTIVEKLERASEKCKSAIILLTKDDEQIDGGSRARQNVIHEVGFFQGKYGRKNVVLICERGVELFSNISGIIRIEFEANNFEAIFESLRLEMETPQA
jgi:predicted nucleotide-binding protein